MFGEQDNRNVIRDIQSRNPLGVMITDTRAPLSYNKTDKLIMALYMVTDIMDSSEPIRLKLRNLGVNILSDIHSRPENSLPKIDQTMSFLEIALSVNLVSAMNAEILRKEFTQLKNSIEAFANQGFVNPKKEISLEDFFEPGIPNPNATRIGVQKASTLMGAIQQVSQKMPIGNMSDKGKKVKDTNLTKQNNTNFDVLKKERREQIMDITKKNLNGVTITDIKKFAYGDLANCGEKTLQRELVSMVKDGLLKKSGEKRWSRYFVA